MATYLRRRLSLVGRAGQLMPGVSRCARTLARLRVHAALGSSVPADLIEDAISCLEEIESSGRNRRQRDRLIRRAGLLSAADTLHAQAKQLQGIAARLKQSHAPLGVPALHAEPATPVDCLRAAAVAQPLPRSYRQFLRILASANA